MPGFALLIVFALVSLLETESSGEALSDPNLNGADTSWMLTATSLVLLMTLGLSFFYGGMVSRKNVISTNLFILAKLYRLLRTSHERLIKYYLLTQV